MGAFVTRADVGFLVVWEAFMLPLAFLAPGQDWRAYALMIGGGVLAGLISRRAFSRRRPAHGSGAPLALGLAVGLTTMVPLMLGLRLAGAHGYFALGAALGVFLAVDGVLDRWWADRSSPAAPVTPSSPT
jgi:hypothetical protein